MEYIARYHFLCNDGSPLVISYLLQNNSLKDRWIKMVKNRSANPAPVFNMSISNKTPDDLPMFMQTLNDIVRKINAYYDKELPLFSNTIEIDRNKLNFLHEEFELYGARHAEAIDTNTYSTKDDTWYNRPFSVDFHETWLKLNEYIHQTESALACSIEDPVFTCAVQFYPFEQGCLVNPEDKLFLTTDLNWGDLLLGYNTLGKDYMDTCWDNDVRVITNHQIKVQEYFSTEVYLNFSFNHYKKSTEEHFWNWYRKLDISTQKLIPIHDRNALSLGRYYLGSVIFDQAFLDLHPNYDDWKNGNKDLRNKWNLEVFSKIEKVTKIEVIDLNDYLKECSKIPYIAELIKDRALQMQQD